MDLRIGDLEMPDVERLDAEIVERKGLGHPDSICDALAEALSTALCRFYLDRFGTVLHHNVDKVLLCAGESEPRFGGGRVTKPIEIFFGGRASLDVSGLTVPLEDIAVETTQDWFRRHMHAIAPERDVKVHTLIRPGSKDLVELYLRQSKTGEWLANDTSCGLGFAPLTRLEQIVLDVEGRLNAPAARLEHPERGQDIKVMAVRQGERIDLTVACAFVDGFVARLEDYQAAKLDVAEQARSVARQWKDAPLSVAVNSADEPEAGSVYLTVTGTSAEAGDDGSAGRGNRANGLITPYRPMTMESVAGKNPITHVGKLYNIVAGLTAERVVEEIAEIGSARCRLVSRIGRPIKDPAFVDIAVCTADGQLGGNARLRIEEILREELEGIGNLADQLRSGEVALDRWPLRRA
ncbi:MAG: methionine adenosyltransferase [Kiloniellales bacterium]|nr:methionine adenosyltransferase [Kiloniellales bacterium]